MKIKKDDTVEVLSGKDRGKKGKVLRVLAKKGRLIVEGVNLSLRHLRRTEKGTKGQEIQMIKSLDISNVALVCPKCQKITRVGYQIAEGKKKRICKKCQEAV